MNLIPESNGLRKVNMREKADAKQWIKNIAFVIVGVFIIGFLIQVISNFVGNEKINSSLNYAKVDSRKMEYKLSGTGDYTVVFDGAIGANLYEWSPVTDALKEKGLDVKTFVYNRRGYGFSDASNSETPEKQAESLKILLRKAGVSGKLILVGEEYGNFVMSEFAELYPESVAGVVMVKPYFKDTIKSEKFKKDIKWNYLKSKVEKTGTKFSLTMLMDKMNIDYHVPKFEESLTEDYLEEFNILKNQTSYRKAINNELGNLYNYSKDEKMNEIISGKPLYVITNDEENLPQGLENQNLATIYKTQSEESVISVTDPSSVATGVSNVVKEAKKIAKKSEG